MNTNRDGLDRKLTLALLKAEPERLADLDPAAEDLTSFVDEAMTRLAHDFPQLPVEQPRLARVYRGKARRSSESRQARSERADSRPNKSQNGSAGESSTTTGRGSAEQEQPQIDPEAFERFADDLIVKWILREADYGLRRIRERAEAGDLNAEVKLLEHRTTALRDEREFMLLYNELVGER